jgi:hypothetical protein
MLARMVDENPPHHPRGHAEEVGAVEPGQLLLAHEPDEGLVDQRRRLQRVIATLSSQVAGRSLAKLLVHERDQILWRLLVSVPPRLEQLTDRSGRCRRHNATCVAALSIWREAVFARFARQVEALPNSPATCSLMECDVVDASERGMSTHPSTVARSPVREATRWFYVWMAGACVLIALVGFAPTYWLQLAPGTFVGSPLLHLHGLLFSAWPLYLLLQTVLAARRRIAHHRAWGLLGVSLATAMVFVGFAVANDVLVARLAQDLATARAPFTSPRPRSSRSLASSSPPRS